jgi:hypothetical protein
MKLSRLPASPVSTRAIQTGPATDPVEQVIAVFAAFSTLARETMTDVQRSRFGERWELICEARGWPSASDSPARRPAVSPPPLPPR